MLRSDLHIEVTSGHSWLKLSFIYKLALACLRNHNVNKDHSDSDLGEIWINSKVILISFGLNHLQQIAMKDYSHIIYDLIPVCFAQGLLFDAFIFNILLPSKPLPLYSSRNTCTKNTSKRTEWSCAMTFLRDTGSGFRKNYAKAWFLSP